MAKVKKDKVVSLAQKITPLLQEHIREIRQTHDADLANGLGRVYLPECFGQKKYPNADREFSCQYVFASRNIATDPRTGVDRHHHIDQSAVGECTGIDKKYRLILFAIRLPRICCKRGWIFAPFKPCLDIVICKPQ